MISNTGGSLNMHIIAFGINHKTAPIEMREQLALNAAHIESTLRELCATQAANEAIILSTCNRTELYVDAPRAQALVRWLMQKIPLSLKQGSWDMAQQSTKSYFYRHYGEAAVRHMMRVASGLDSMVLGEPEILGQMKQAFGLAKKVGTVGKKLDPLFQSIFSTAKQVRSETGVGLHSLSMPYAIVQLAGQIFADVRQCRVLLIGAGDMIARTATYLHQQGVHDVTIANRSLHRVGALANHFHLRPIDLRDIPVYLPQVDWVISATGSELPILGKGMVETALKARRHRPMLMVDLAMPRDIEPQIEQLKDVYLYHLDDLQRIIKGHCQAKSFAMQQAEGVIQLQAAHLMRQAQMLNVGDIIATYRHQVSKTGQVFEQYAQDQLKTGACPEQIIKDAIRGLTHTMMHAPTIEMRQAAYTDNANYLSLLTELFTPNIPEIPA
jgi:glutamyl-tRNA reductase